MTARRRRAPDGYHAMVGGLGGSIERIEMDVERERAAVRAAFGACSPFGHTLVHGGRFLGYFEPGDARTHREEPFPEGAIRRAAGRPDAPW